MKIPLPLCLTSFTKITELHSLATVGFFLPLWQITSSWILIFFLAHGFMSPDPHSSPSMTVTGFTHAKLCTLT